MRLMHCTKSMHVPISGGVHKLVSNLLRNKLVVHDAKKYDGYRLTFLGYDFLALR